jgi:hypothetical protein
LLEAAADIRDAAVAIKKGVARRFGIGTRISVLPNSFPSLSCSAHTPARPITDFQPEIRPVKVSTTGVEGTRNFLKDSSERISSQG